MPNENHQLDLLSGIVDSGSLGDIEKWASHQGHNYLIGVDEAGRGPLAGPVVSAAVCLPVDFTLAGLNDSKKLSLKTREKLYPQIMQSAVSWGVGFGLSGLIDEVNILQATKFSMLKAIELSEIRGMSDLLVVIDGNQPLKTERQQRTVVGGDRLSVSIAAASVIAKVLRDKWMLIADKRWPEYSFAKHKGYGTKAHMTALKEFGPCPIHRMSFKPVKNSVKTGDEQNTLL